MKKTIVVSGLTLALVIGSAFAVMAGDSQMMDSGSKVYPCVAQNAPCHETQTHMNHSAMHHDSAAVQKAVTTETNPNASMWDSTERKLGIE